MVRSQVNCGGAARACGAQGVVPDRLQDLGGDVVGVAGIGVARGVAAGLGEGAGAWPPRRGRRRPWPRGRSGRSPRARRAGRRRWLPRTGPGGGRRGRGRGARGARRLARELRPLPSRGDEVDSLVAQSPARGIEGSEVLAGGSARHREHVGAGQAEGGLRGLGVGLGMEPVVDAAGDDVGVDVQQLRQLAPGEVADGDDDARALRDGRQDRALPAGVQRRVPLGWRRAAASWMTTALRGKASGARLAGLSSSRALRALAGSTACSQAWPRGARASPAAGRPRSRRARAAARRARAPSAPPRPARAAPRPAR